MATSLDDIMRFKIFLERYPHLTSESNLRWLFFNRETNGITESGAMFKRGGAVYVVAPKMLGYLLGEETAA